MTWTKLPDGGYDSLTGEFDTENYDYYIADRTTKLQIRLTGTPAYNNGVLAMDTIMNNLYGNLTEIELSDGTKKKVEVVLARNAKFEDFYDANTTTVNGDYGKVWSTNASATDSATTGAITSTWNRYAPTLFAYENIDSNNGISKGYSDAKITSYNMSTTGVQRYLSEGERSSYSYEYYNEDPGLNVICNVLWGTKPTKNTAQASTGTSFWLSSRCVYATWGNAHFDFRYMSGSGTFNASYMLHSNTAVYSYCFGLRPVLQVAK